MKCYYLLLLCIPLCLEVNALDEAKLTLLHDAVNEGAVCLDGTAPGYYMRKGEVHVCTMYIHTYYIYIYIYITLRLIAHHFHLGMLRFDFQNGGLLLYSYVEGCCKAVDLSGFPFVKKGFFMTSVQNKDIYIYI